MVFNVDPESDKVLAAIRKADRVEEYECPISACDSPVCMCDSVYLELLPVECAKNDPPRRPHKVTIRLAEKKLDFTGKFGTPRDDLDLSRPFLSALDESDFRLLRERHHLFKFRYQISENAPVDSIEFDFDYDYVERDGVFF